MKVIRFTEGVNPYNAGETAGFPEETADYYIAKGWAVELDEDGTPIDIDESGDTPTLESMTKEELIALAAERGIEVAREDGEEGEPLKDDYVRALTE